MIFIVFRKPSDAIWRKKFFFVKNDQAQLVPRAKPIADLVAGCAGIGSGLGGGRRRAGRDDSRRKSGRQKFQHEFHDVRPVSVPGAP